MEEKKRGVGRPDSFEPNEIQIGACYLLGFGIDAYNHFNRLNNAKKDIEDFTKVLTEKYTFENNNVELVFNQDATRRNIINKLHEFQEKVKEEDKLVIYYSGHGYLNPKNGLGYWIPVDADNNEIADYISNSEIREIINTYIAKHILLISDSCFSSTLLVRKVNSTSKTAYSEWEKDKSRYIFSSGKGVVLDGIIGQNSPFALNLIKCLGENDFEPLNIGNIADKVIKVVKFNYEQQAELSPLFQSGHLGGQFVFFPKNHITGFQKVIYFRDKNDYVKATIELKKYLIDSNILPDEYLFDLSLLSNRLIRNNHAFRRGRIEDEEFKHQDENINLSIIKFFKIPSKITINKFEIIFNLIAKDKITEAIDLLSINYENNFIVFSELILLKSFYNSILKAKEKDVIHYINFNTLYDNLLFRFITLLFRIDKSQNTLKTEIEIANDYLNNIEIVIELTKYLYDSADGNVEEQMYLVKMISSNFEKNILELINSNIKRDIFDRNLVKIKLAVSYLLSLFDDKLIKTKPSIEKDLFNQINDIIIQDRIDDIFKLNIDSSKLDSLSIIFSKYNSAKTANIKNTISYNDWLIRKNKFFGEIIDCLFETINKAVFTNGAHLNLKTLVEVHNVSNYKILQIIYSNIKSANIENAFKYALHLNFEPNQNDFKNHIIRLNFEFFKNLEDKLFTIKDLQLIESRNTKLVYQLLGILSEYNIESNSQETSSKNQFSKEELLISLSKRELEKSINLLYFSKALYNEICLLEYRFNSLKNDFRLGLVDYEYYSIGCSKLDEAILFYVNEL